MPEMTRGEFLNILSKRAREYSPDAIASLTRNHHMNDLTGGKIYQDKDNIKLVVDIDQRVVDAVLVDFINYVGMSMCVDYGLYTKRLKEKEANQ